MDNSQFGTFEGTSIAQLKEPVRMTETDIDYDKIINNLNLSENKIGIEMKPKKASNMNHFVKNLENDLDNYGSRNVQYGEPMPANLTKEMMQSIQNDKKDKVIPSMPQPVVIVNKKEETIPEKIQSFANKIIHSKHRDIIISILMFMILNNKFVIEFIYEKIPKMKSIDSPYPNLIIRSLIFGGLLYLLKRFNI